MLLNNLLLKIVEKVKGDKTGVYLKMLMKNENISIHDVNKLQLTLFNILFQRIIQNSHPYYSQFKVNFQNSNSLFETLQTLPIIDKSVIRNAGKSWITQKESLTICLSTSGSSGIPFEIHHSKESYEIKGAGKERALARFGIGRNEFQMSFGCGYTSSSSTLISKIKLYIHNRIIMNKLFTDITRINKKSLQKNIEDIILKKPTTIWGYPSFIKELACYGIDNNIKFNNPNLKAVVISGETCNDKMREDIIQFFKVPIIDEYNSNEGFLASSCREGNLHISEDTVFMMVRKENGELSLTGRGELILTQLYSSAFPLINYTQGDIIEIVDNHCSCGSNFRIIKEVVGRSGATPIHNGDEIIGIPVFNHVITKSIYREKIAQYQLVQNKINIIEIFIVLRNENQSLDGFKNFMQEIFYNCEVKIHLVSNISREKSGKFKDVIVNIQ